MSRFDLDIMSRKTKFAPKEYYHLYNRGTDKRNIFLREVDYERFLALLYLCNSQKSIRASDYNEWQFSEILSIDKGERLVDICSYCLMPNHFHLIVYELEEGGISKFMQKLLTGYTMYFNTLHERNGALFQGKFKAEHAGDDRYLKYLFSYIHLNPIKLIEREWKKTGIKDLEGALRFLKNYRYSSFPGLLKIVRPENAIISLSHTPKYFESEKELMDELIEWLTCDPVKVEP
jgi:putative transposase